MATSFSMKVGWDRRIGRSNRTDYKSAMTPAKDLCQRVKLVDEATVHAKL
jgi:hypothetical protein